MVYSILNPGLFLYCIILYPHACSPIHVNLLLSFSVLTVALFLLLQEKSSPKNDKKKEKDSDAIVAEMFAQLNAIEEKAHSLEGKYTSSKSEKSHRKQDLGADSGVSKTEKKTDGYVPLRSKFRQKPLEAHQAQQRKCHREKSVI